MILTNLMSVIKRKINTQKSVLDNAKFIRSLSSYIYLWLNVVFRIRIVYLSNISAEEIRESGRSFHSLIVWETTFIAFWTSGGYLKCQEVLISATPSLGIGSSVAILPLRFRPLYSNISRLPFLLFLRVFQTVATQSSAKESYFRLNVSRDVINAQWEQQGTKKSAMLDTRHKGNSVWFNIWPAPVAQVVERSLQDREVVGSKPARAASKALKWYQWLPYLTLTIIRPALTSLLSQKRITNITQLTKKKSDDNQCLFSPEDRM